LNFSGRQSNWQFDFSLTPDPSFGHNLCFKCPNEECEPILDIQVPKDFQWYKERHKPLSFDPLNYSLKFWESIEIPSPKVGVTLGEWGFTPSQFLTLPGVCDVTPGLPLGPQPCNPFALVANPRLGLWQILPCSLPKCYLFFSTSHSSTKFMNIFIHGWPLITNIKDLPHNDVKGKMSPTSFIM